MDLIKRKFERNKKKKADRAKSKTKNSKTTSKSPTAKKKKKKAQKKRASRQSTSSSSSSEDSDNSSRVRLKAVQSKLAVDAAFIDKKYRMTGSLIKKPENPVNFAREVMRADWQEMNTDLLTSDQIRTLDEYLKNRAELKSTDHVVIAEKVDDDDKKATTRLKILTKFDEGRFAAIYMVQNEAAVDNDVVSVGNGRFMMKTALRLLSSHQITYRLSREINVLKALWNKPNDQPQRIPPVLHDGRILGVPFYGGLETRIVQNLVPLVAVTQIYDINLEKCREEMGGGTFALYSIYHIGQEILAAIRYLHRRQFVHRDIKPMNIVFSLTAREQWFLVDYGDTVPAGRTSVLSPPDGHTLTFLSREAHEVIAGGSVASTYQQDLESWWLMLVDMYKPLPWRENAKIDSVQRAKAAYFTAPPTDLPPHLAEIGRLLKTDAVPYKEIARQLSEAMAANKSTSWTAEWLDRAAAKRRATKRRAVGKKKSSTASVAMEESTNAGNEEEGGQGAPTPPQPSPNKRDRSVYCQPTESGPPAAQPPTARRRTSKESDTKPQGTNKMASVMEDIPAPPPPPPTPRPDRSVYFKDFPPVVTPVNDTKRKYRYKPSNK